MNQRYDFVWDFPLPSVHNGLLLGNGTMGVMIWGGQNILHVTLGRADWWDHRGGKLWTTAMNWRDIRRHLEAGDETSLRGLFKKPGGEISPTLLSVGRFDLCLPDGAVIRRGRLDRANGVVSIEVEQQKATHQLLFELCMDRNLLRCDTAGVVCDVIPRPAYVTAGAAMASRQISPPTMLNGDSLGGFSQATPGDKALAAVARKSGQTVWISTALAADADAAGAAATDLVQAGTEASFAPSHQWWMQYWNQCATISIPNPKLQFLYDLGTYKFAGLTNPLGTPAGLQGPWIEDYALPPWSGDYHFNINVQMCYAPAYACNLLPHVRPMLDLVWGWRDQLRENARRFIGIDDGLMLPHAVDDRGQIIGQFWTGTIDHGCTAWVGKMMYDYWSFGGADDDYAVNVVLPFLRGAMRVYEEMLETDGDGLVLPVSVSPEYRGAAMNAWGRNASFQLACIHWLCERLLELTARFKEAQRPIWHTILNQLPKATVNKKIDLWQGTGLEESHRHHSHLAGIVPFDIFDPADASWQSILRLSIRDWIYRGTGLWSGWAMPWAAQLHTRMGHADMAELTLENWQRVFTNRGHGTLHDCRFPGFTLLGDGASAARGRSAEIMQMDAGMGVVQAITDLLLHERRGVHHLFAGCPDSWQEVSFTNLRTAGGFLVSATRSAGIVRRLSIKATRDGTFRVILPSTGEVADFKLADGAEAVPIVR